MLHIINEGGQQKQQYTGIVDYMKSQGQDFSKENRKMLFAQFFPGVEFTGTEDQNNLLMGKLKDPNNPLGTGVTGQGTDDPTNPNAGNAGQGEFQSADPNIEGQFRKGLELNPDGSPKNIAFSRDTDTPEGDVTTQQFSLEETQNQNLTVDPTTETGLASSLSGSGYGGETTGEGQLSGLSGPTGANSQTSKAVDFGAQKDVDESKEELEKLKPPQTLFGMASKALDASGFTQGAKEFGQEAGGWGMEGLGKMGMDAGIMGNIGGAAQGAAGFGGKMLGMAGSALSPLMAGMGTAMHGIGRGMMGIQMPRY